MSDVPLSQIPRAQFALWNLGFRPLYLAAGGFAALAIALWTAQVAGWISVSYLSHPYWHAHEMIFGYALAVIAGFLLYRFEPLPVQVMRNAVFDQYQRWQPRAYEDMGVRIVDIDDESLKRIGQWPWPRARMADLASRLLGAGAARPRHIVDHVAALRHDAVQRQHRNAAT